MAPHKSHLLFRPVVILQNGTRNQFPTRVTGTDKKSDSNKLTVALLQLFVEVPF